MSKFGDKLIKSVEEGVAIVNGELDPSTYRIRVPAQIDVAALRRKLGVSQAEFSQRYGFNAASVKDWEQGRATPTGPVRAYLRVIEKEPEAVQRALAAA